MQQRSQEAERERLAAAGPAPADGRCEVCGVSIPAVLVGEGWHVAVVCRDCAHIRDKREHHLAALRLTPRQATMTFDTFTPATASQQRALEVVRAGGSAWLHGRPGTGKSHLLTAAAIEAVGARVQMWPALELMAELRRDARDSNNSEPTMHAVCSCDLLIIDDLDAPRGTDFTLESWHRIAEARYTENLRTLISSNLDPRQTAARVGARVYSRLIGLCDGAVVHVEGPDGRRPR